MTETPTRLLDAFGTPIERGDHVTPLADPTRAVLVTEVADDGLLTVRHGRDDYPARAHMVRVVTVRDSAGARLAPGDVVRGVGQAPGDETTRVIDAVLYGPHLVVLAADARHPERTPVLPVLLVRVGAAIREGDQVVDDMTGALLVVLGEVAGDPGRVTVEPVYGGGRREVPRARLRRVVEAEHGIAVGRDGSFAVAALGDDPAGPERLLAECEMSDNVIPLPRRAARG